MEGCGIGYDPKGVIEVRDVRSDARQPAAPLWTGPRGIPFENAPASRMTCSGVLWLCGRRLGPQRLLSRVQCSVVARFEDPESAYLWRRSVGVEAVSDYRIKMLTCTWHGGRTVHSTSRQPRGPLSAIRYRTKKRWFRCRRERAQPLRLRTVRACRTDRGRSEPAYVTTRWDVPSSSGLNPRSGLRRSTLALFVHSVRVEDLLLTKRHTLSGPV